MTSFASRPLVRLILAGALIATALGLSACGRKGPLDPPPGTSIADTPQPNAVRGMIKPTPQPAPENAVDEQGRPIAPTGPRKRIPLDAILN